MSCLSLKKSCDHPKFFLSPTKLNLVILIIYQVISNRKKKPIKKNQLKFEGDVVCNIDNKTNVIISKYKNS